MLAPSAAFMWTPPVSPLHFLTSTSAVAGRDAPEERGGEEETADRPASCSDGQSPPGILTALPPNLCSNLRISRSVFASDEAAGTAEASASFLRATFRSSSSKYQVVTAKRIFVAGRTAWGTRVSLQKRTRRCHRPPLFLRLPFYTLRHSKNYCYGLLDVPGYVCCGCSMP